MAAADSMMVLILGGVALVGVFWFMNQQGVSSPEELKEIIKKQFGNRGGMDLNEVEEGYESPTLNKIRTKDQLDRSEIGDYLEGIREEIGADYARAYPGLKVGQQPNFIPPGHRTPLPGMRRRRRRGVRSHMAIHYE